MVFDLNGVTFSLPLEVLESFDDVKKIYILSRDPKELFFHIFLYSLVLSHVAFHEYHFSGNFIALSTFIRDQVDFLRRVLGIGVSDGINREVSCLNIAMSVIIPNKRRTL